MMDCMHITWCGCCCCYNEQCPCFGRRGQAKDKYPHIEYYQPNKAIDVSDTPEAPHQRAPVKRVFEFPQESRELHHHPQLKGATGFTLPVTQQPTHDSNWEPMYVSNKGRTIGTVSEIPHSPSTPEPPPFTPPAEDQPDSTATVDQSVQYAGHGPAIQFSIYYDIQKRELTVSVLGAYNLPSRGDFFMAILMMPSRDKIYHTRVSTGTANPTFNQTFLFPNISTEDLTEQVMVFQIFSRDKFTRDNLVGTVIVPLSTADLLGMNVVKKIGEGRELLQVCVCLLSVIVYTACWLVKCMCTTRWLGGN